MKTIVPVAALAAAFLSLQANAGSNSDDPFKNLDCKKAQVQMELDYCAGKDFDAADKRLNALYRKLMAGNDAKTQALLKVAEKSWLAYRDSECAYETSDSEGGSIQPMEGSICLTQKTEARIKELQSQAQ